MLYLVLKELLDSPIIYLSSYLIRNKSAYYRLLQEVRTHENWEEWIIYILAGVEETAGETLRLVKRINAEVKIMSTEIKEKLPKIYSKELIDLLFDEFYTKTVYIKNGLERIYQNKRLYDLIKYKK